MSSLLLGLVLTSAVAQIPAPPPTVEPAAPRGAMPIGSGTSGSLQPSAPFRKLFASAAGEAASQERARHALQQHSPAGRAAPKVVCGMIVIPTDPQVDAKMIRRPPEASTTMHIKKIAPVACAE